MHHNRHKEILRIVRQITALDKASASPSNKLGSIAKTPRESSTAASICAFTDASSDTTLSTEHLTRKERKKAKKAGNGSTKDRQTVESFPREELDFISEAIHLTVHESKGAWEGTYIYDSKEQPVEEDKSVSIAEGALEDKENDSFTEQSDSLSVKAPYEMTPRQRKIIKTFNTPISHSSFGGGSRKYTPNRDRESDLYDGVDPQIFFRLGIEVVNPRVNSKSRKELVARLVTAVKEDLEIIIREDAESAMREEGFWRWAGKTAYDHIKRTREIFDWATGQKKGPQRTEYSEDDLLSTAEGFEDLEIAGSPSPAARVEEPAKEPTIEAPKMILPKKPKKAKRKIIPKPETVREEDENEMAVEVKVGPTYAMVVKVLAPEPTPIVGYPAEDDFDGWETVSRHKKMNSKSGQVAGHKRTTSRTITVR
jgi:hypothetical protein